MTLSRQKFPPVASRKIVRTTEPHVIGESGEGRNPTSPIVNMLYLNLPWIGIGCFIFLSLKIGS